MSEGGKQNNNFESSIESNGSLYRVRIPSEASSDLETSVRTTASYISNNDYDELESIVDALKNDGTLTLKAPMQIKMSPSRHSKTAGTSPNALKSVKEEKTDAFGYHQIDIDKLSQMKVDDIKRSQSVNDMFDDPKYNKLIPVNNDVPSALQLYKPQVFQEMTSSSSDKNRHGLLSMKRSVSTSDADVIPFERQDYKEYMSLQQLLDLVNTKLTPSRETSVEEMEGETEEELYCPRVVRPVPIDIY